MNIENRFAVQGNIISSAKKHNLALAIRQHAASHLGMYFREPRSPSEHEIQLIDYPSRIVGIAMEREFTRNSLQRAFDQIQKSERELRQLIDFLPEHVFVLEAEGAVIQANRTMLEYTGRTLEEMQEVGTDERMKRDLHPEDFERVRRERRAGISRRLRFELEMRALGKDGRYRWFFPWVFHQARRIT